MSKSEPEFDDYTRAQAMIAALDEPKEGQIYSHVKGGLYSVRVVSIDEETLTPLVTYTSNKYGGATTRKLDVFLSRFTRYREG